MNSRPLIDLVGARFPEAVLSSHSYRGDETVVLRRDRLVDAARFVKEDGALCMDYLIDVTAVDYSTFGKSPRSYGFFSSSGVAVKQPTAQVRADERWPGPPSTARFAVVYHFFSRTLKHRLRLVVPIEEADAEVDSLSGLWAAADWLEREVWDMYGIRFRGHPNLKRILMYEEFEGHPLRKDYPVKKRQPRVGPVN